MFPLTLQPLAINRPVSIEAVNRALAGDRLVFLTLQTPTRRSRSRRSPTIGTIAAIRQMAQGRTAASTSSSRACSAREAGVVDRTGDVDDAPRRAAARGRSSKTLEVDAYVRRLQELVDRALSLSSGLSQELRGLVAGIDDPLRLAYLLGSLLDMKPEEKQQILEDDTLIGEAARRSSTALGREIALLEMKGKIESQAQQEMTDAQRQYYLRQQLKAIQEELGEGEADEIADAARAASPRRSCPRRSQQVAERELDRLERMTPASPEYQMIRTYLDWVLDVPWSITHRGSPRSGRGAPGARRGSLRSRQGQGAHRRVPGGAASSKGDMKGPILCFVGPPGVGKTSLGQSIARAMNRKFVRISLGGVRDEAEIRGHRRTYIGALPGRIVQALKQAGAMNPVFMLDEIDKISAGFQGDPAAALLEVLDPAQNHSFRDHYLEVRSISRACCSSPPPTSSARCIRRCSTGWRSSRSPATPRRRSFTSRAGT